MIFQSPFYRPPYFYNPTYARNYINNSTYRRPNVSKKESTEEPPKKIDIETSNSNTRKDNDNNEFIEIFGIKLFFDDILILCLLFFLYKQNVNDPLLFIALLLLLLS